MSEDYSLWESEVSLFRVRIDSVGHSCLRSERVDSDITCSQY
jgi:hypothetical protein